MGRSLAGAFAFGWLLAWSVDAPAQTVTAPATLEWAQATGPLSGTVVYDYSRRRGSIATAPGVGMGACRGELTEAPNPAVMKWWLSCDGARFAYGTLNVAEGRGTGIDAGQRRITLLAKLAPPPSAPPAPVASKPAANTQDPQALAKMVTEAVDPLQRTATVQPPQSYASVDEIKQKTYAHMMTLMARATVSDKSSGPAASYAGRSYDYKGLQGAKVLAACVNWDSSSIAALKIGGFGFSDGQHYGPRMGLMRESALEACSRQMATTPGGCRCTLVDENGRNVLDVPGEFAQRLMKR